LEDARSRLFSLFTEWLNRRGFYYLEGASLRGASGRVYSVPLIVFTDDGAIPVDYVGERISRAALAKVETLIKDAGVRGAGVLAGDAGPEELYNAFKARVDVFTLKGLELLNSLAASGLDAVFLIPDPRSAGDPERLVESRCAGRIKRLLGKPKVEAKSCVYLPVYACKASAGARRATAFLAVSALTGGVLYAEKGVLREGLLKASRLPDELKPVYSRLRGERIARRDFVRVWGRRTWSRFLGEAEKLGLASLEKGEELVVVDDVPRIEDAEAAAETLLAPATRSPASHCSVALPTVSPGKAAAELYKVAGWRIHSYTLLFAPLYLAEVEGELCGVTLWRGEPLTYKSLPPRLLELQG